MKNEHIPAPPPDEATPSDDNSDGREAKMREYRKRYWERFAKTRKRVYGTLSGDEYAAIERRAEEAGRAVWSQIHAEAEAYARGEYLPPKEIDEHIRDLIIQLRRIGSNVNQITREFHSNGTHDEPDLLRNLHELELLIRAFVKRPWGDISGEPSDDNNSGVP